MEDKELRIFLQLQDNKKKIERLKSLYLPEDIQQAESGVNNLYKRELDALLAERQKIINPDS